MYRTVIIHAEYHDHVSADLPGAVSVRFTVDRPGKLLGTIELAPIPSTGSRLRSALGLGLGIGVAANLIRSEPNITSLALQLPGPVHPGWQVIADLFTRLCGVTLTLDTRFSEGLHVPPAVGPVFLLSGGKDTLFTLVQAQKTQALQGRPALYLGAGSELNWRNEFPQVRRLAQHFGLQLHHVRLYQMLVSSKGALRFGNRAMWRELVTLALARCYGDHIHTGINDDAISRLSISDPHYADFLSQLLPTVRAMEEILGARIETAPGELEVYQHIRDHPLFDQSGSCLRPDCGQPNLCAKCRTFEIYERILAGASLGVDDIEFIYSDYYLGDAALLLAYRLQ